MGLLCGLVLVSVAGDPTRGEGLAATSVAGRLAEPHRGLLWAIPPEALSKGALLTASTVKRYNPQRSLISCW